MLIQLLISTTYPTSFEITISHTFRKLLKDIFVQTRISFYCFYSRKSNIEYFYFCTIHTYVFKTAYHIKVCVCSIAFWQGNNLLKLQCQFNVSLTPRRDILSRARLLLYNISGRNGTVFSVDVCSGHVKIYPNIIRIYVCI